MYQAPWGTIYIFTPSEDQMSKSSSMAHRTSSRSAKERGVQASILVACSKAAFAPLFLYKGQQ